MTSRSKEDDRRLRIALTFRKGPLSTVHLYPAVDPASLRPRQKASGPFLRMRSRTAPSPASFSRRTGSVSPRLRARDGEACQPHSKVNSARQAKRFGEALRPAGEGTDRDGTQGCSPASGPCSTEACARRLRRSSVIRQGDLHCGPAQALINGPHRSQNRKKSATKPVLE